MIKNLFLTGTKHLGKSTLLREALRPYRHLAGGYYIRRINDPDAERLAYRILDISSGPYYLLNATAPVPTQADIIAITDRQKKGIEIFPHVLETRGVEILNSARHKNIILMDELGRFELQAPRFVETVFALLQEPRPVVGVLKKERNVFLDEVAHHHAHLILDLDQMTPEFVQAQLAQFLRTSLST